MLTRGLIAGEDYAANMAQSAAWMPEPRLLAFPIEPGSIDMMTKETPPIRVVHVQAGENVAIQINENTRVMEAPHAVQQIEGHGTPSGRSERPERRILSASAPAGPVEAEKAPD